MRIAIYGVGGAGGYFGARLAQSGEEVIFIARGEHLAAIREHGLIVESIKGDVTIENARAEEDPAKVGPVDLVLVCVKAWQVPDAAKAIVPMLGPETVVLPMQNGVEAALQLEKELGAKHVLGGLAKIISFKSGPGRIQHVGADPYLAFGELDKSRSERVAMLRNVLEKAGIVVDTPDDIHAAIWEKFLLVASWGGVGAVTRLPIGVIRTAPETRRMLVTAMEEIRALAIKRGIDVPEAAIEKSMGFFDSLPPAGTTSMQRDIAEGRPSELDSWNGAVSRLAGESGVATPLNDFIHACLLPHERRARGEMAFPE